MMLPRRRGPKCCGGNRGRDAVDGKFVVDVLDAFFVVLGVVSMW